MKTTAGLELSHAPFEKPPLHIPNAKGQPYKTELVEVRSPELTIKWNFWHFPDDDRAPHNHPWDFKSTIVHGGYTEKRYWLDEVDGLKTEEKEYKVGDVADVPRGVYHRVIAVLPGTVTRMVCGPAAPGNDWGYLDLTTWQHVKAGPDPDFMTRLRANNQFLK